MKILLISVKTTESKGGIAVWTENYLSGFEGKDAIVHIVNTVTTGERLKNASAKRSLSDEWQRTSRIMKDLKAELKENSFDVAHLNTSIGVFGIIRDYMVARKIAEKKIPIVLHFHCDIPFWVKNSVIKYFLKKILKLSSVNLVLCESSKKYLMANYGAESIKVPNFVDSSLLVEKKEIHEVLKKAFFVGRVSFLKGAKEIFELAKKFHEIEFELAGEVCDGIENWEKPDNISLIGMIPHDEVIRHLDNSDIFIFPTYTEGFSVALAESMARGIPAVTTDVGANLDMIENKGGAVVQVGNTKAMEKAINNLRDKETRSKMSEWNIQKVKNEYTAAAIINKFSEIYGEAEKC